MIIYDKNYQILAISDTTLKILDFKDASEFLNKHKDFGELVVGLENSAETSFIKRVLNSPNSSLSLNLMTKSCQLISVIVRAQTLNFIDGQRMYELELIPKNATIELDNEDRQSSIRLPILQDTYAKAKSQNQQNLLDERWFEQTARFLNLSALELCSYLQVLQNELTNETNSLQNAIISQDHLAIKKILSPLKEPAMNLKIAPLVKICEIMPEANLDELAILMAQYQKCAQDLDELITKYQGNA